MSAAADTIAVVLGAALRAALETPEGKKLLREAEDALIASAPGAVGALMRGLALLVPHDAPSIGFRRDGPG